MRHGPSDASPAHAAKQTRACLVALLVVAGCRSQPPAGTNVDRREQPAACPTHACADTQAAPVVQASTDSESGPQPQPRQALLLHIDPQMPAQLGPLDSVVDTPVQMCDEAQQRALDCGLAEVCAELGPRWAKQLTRELGDMPGLIDELRAASYPERCDGSEPAAPSQDFAARAVQVRHIIEGNLVSGLFVLDAGRWRGRARICEHVVSGLAMRIQQDPIAAWQLDIDDQPGRELIVLIRGHDAGHASDKDPLVRARVIICGTAPRGPAKGEDENGPWCGRIELGAWPNENPSERPAASARRSGWIGQLDIYPGELELVADDPDHTRTLSLTDLERADQRLIAPPNERSGGSR